MVNIREIFGGKVSIENLVCVRGWVKSHQQHGLISFINIGDGSTLENLQVIYKDSIEIIPIGSSVEVSGFLKQSQGKQDIELLADKVVVLAKSEDFPIQKKEHSLEYLREVAHIRHRTNLFFCVNKIRDVLYCSIQQFFSDEGFFWVQAPILTSNSCEGGSEAFEIKNSENFFKKKALLSVSGQFHAEALALGLGKVYTFGPTFRSEKSNSSSHLAEFWMIEPEAAFFDLDDNMNLIERFIKYVVDAVLEKCEKELVFLKDKLPDNEKLICKLKDLVGSEFEKIEYRDAIKILTEGGYKVVFGDDFNSEQEKYITNKFNKPVFVMNYPKKIKAFYMKEIDEEVVSSVDLLVPEVGELIGGSAREASLEILKKKASEMNIPTGDLEWYLEIRKHGYYSSAGFGCGFERLILYVTGLKNIRDAISYPRSYNHLDY